jgi:uncharacterized membrane protein
VSLLLEPSPPVDKFSEMSQDAPACRERTGQSERDIVVEYIAWMLGLVQLGLNGLLRQWQSRLLQRRGQPWLYFNYIYMIEWAVILASLSVATVYASSGWRIVLVAVGLWRLAEITVWYAKLLLDKTHSNVLSGERNLVFLICDMRRPPLGAGLAVVIGIISAD